MKEYIGSDEHWEDSINQDYDEREQHSKEQIDDRVQPDPREQQAQSGRVDCYTEPAVQGDLVAEDPKYLLTESEILEIVDGCFHCYASSYRIEAADLTRKILLSKQTV